MERVTKFIARDLQEFLTEKECIAHERGLDFTEAFSQFVVTHVGTTPCDTEEAQAAFDKLTDAIRKHPDDFEIVLNAARGKGVKKIKKKKPRPKPPRPPKLRRLPPPSLRPPPSPPNGSRSKTLRKGLPWLRSCTRSTPSCSLWSKPSSARCSSPPFPSPPPMTRSHRSRLSNL